jgi:hypothetical protein
MELAGTGSSILRALNTAEHSPDNVGRHGASDAIPSQRHKRFGDHDEKDSLTPPLHNVL